MDKTLVKAVPTVLGSPEEIHSKIAAFKEIGALIEAGFFPDGIKKASQAIAVCWMADAIGVHPMVALQNVIPIHQRLYIQWRLKWGLIKSRYPDAEMEKVSQDATQCTARARTSPSRSWVSVTFTKEQCEANPVTSKNPLYKSDWPDMSFKACAHRLADLIAPEVMMGLPSGDSAPEFTAPEPIAPADPAQVLAKASESKAEVVPDEPAEMVRDYVKDLFTFIRKLYTNGKKGEKDKEKRAIEAAINAARGTKDFTLPGVLAPSVAREALEYLEKKYPGGNLRPESAENGGTVLSGTPSPSGAAVEADATVDPDVKGFDEQHADENLEPPVEEPAVPIERPGGTEDPAVTALAAADRAAWEADGTTIVLFNLVKAGKKTFPTRRFVVEAPAGSGAWYFVDAEISKERGYKSGRLLMKDGAQAIEADECRILVELLRQAGVEGPTGR